MIDIHWFSFIVWIVGAFAFGWGAATWRAKKVFREVSGHIDKAIGAVNDVVKTSQELNDRTTTANARLRSTENFAKRVAAAEASIAEIREARIASKDRNADDLREDGNG